MPGRRRFEDYETDFPDRDPSPGRSPQIFKIGERNSLRNSYRLSSVYPRTQNSNGSLANSLVKGINDTPPTDLTSARQSANASPSRMVYAAQEAARASDRRRYHPAGSDRWPSNLFGASAQLNTAQKFLSNTDLCVDRVTRRQVLFARRKAGHGFHTKKRRGPFSHIGC